jgi:hypothetical protein
MSNRAQRNRGRHRAHEFVRREIDAQALRAILHRARTAPLSAADHDMLYPFGQPRLARASAIGDDPRTGRSAEWMGHGIDGQGWSGGGGAAGRRRVSSPRVRE